MLQGSGDDVHDGPLEAFGESFRGLPACTQLPRGAISPGEQSTIVRDCHLSTVGSVPASPLGLGQVPWHGRNSPRDGFFPVVEYSGRGLVV